MNKKNVYLGIGMGMAAVGAVAMMTRPKKRMAKSAVGKALRTMGEMADSISDAMGW